MMLRLLHSSRMLKVSNRLSAYAAVYKPLFVDEGMKSKLQLQGEPSSL
jgi:hypothetical protein